MRAVEPESGVEKSGTVTNRPARSAARLRKLKLRARAVSLEGLEPRTLMAVLPAALVSGQTVVSPGPGGHGNQSSPSVAIDPTNPQHLVAVWTSYDTTRTGNFNPPVVAQGATSSDGGATWNSFSPAAVQIDPTSDPKNPADFAQTTDASVDFDRNGNFYVVVSEHNAAESAGAILLNKFAFSNTFNPTVNNEVLYSWTRDAALKPSLAVDHNLPTFSDVNGSGQTVTQSDKSTGNVYVSWATADANADGAGNFNPNAIKVVASSDGGSTFSGYKNVNVGGNSGNQRETSPRLVVSQGSATVPGGEVSLVYDDFGTSAGANPPVDILKTNTIAPGTLEKVYSNNVPGTIVDSPSTPANTSVSSPYPVNVTGGLAGLVSDLAVNVTLSDTALANVQLDLRAPDGTIVNLAPVGKLAGTVMGVGTGGQNYGVTFSRSGPSSIVNAAAPYIGTFRPTGDLSQFNGKPVQTGTWQIIATVNKNGSGGSFSRASLAFTTGLTLGVENSTVTTTVRGAQGINYGTASPADLLGIGPDPSLASDNTLGAFSPHQGRLYMTYVNRSTKPAGNPADNTDVYVRSSDDGGVTWGAPTLVNDDVAQIDGFSEGDRAQFEPSVAVDQSTGTLVVTYFDGRYDGARARVATTIAASVDGGASFGPQAFANAAQTVTNLANNQTVTLGPVLDNESAGNTAANADLNTFGFGDRQGLAVFDGHVYPAWSSNMNGGQDGKTLLNTTVAQATIAAGPRIVSGTMGPVGQAGDTLNNVKAADGGPEAKAIQVVFDRPIDPSTFTAADVVIQGRDAGGNLLSTQPAVIGNPVPLDVTQFGATTFQINFTAQNTPGTYSYTVGPNVSDRIRQVLTPTFTGAQIAGNAMDENGNAVTAQPNVDQFSIPTPTNGTPLVAPFSVDTLPLIVSGPHVVSSSIPGSNSSSDNLVTNNTVNAIDVTFDRNMDPTSFGIPAGTPVGTVVSNGNIPVVRIQGPAGLINGPYAVREINPKVFEFGFPTQQLSGTYTITLGASIRSASGFQMDANLNAGLDAVRQTTSTATVSDVFNSTDTPVPLAPSKTITSSIVVNDNFTIKGLTLTLDIADQNDSNLTAVLVTPNGRTVQLFSGVGNVPGSKANFANTIFDDNASTPIANGGPPFVGRFKPQQTLFVPGESSTNGLTAGVYTLKITDNSATNTGTLNAWSLAFQKSVTGTGLGETVADQTEVSFRIFTMDPTNPLSSGTWTSVGPASIGGSNSGRIGGLAMDPSDPSGNTVYVGGASGGVWKTTNFLTTNPNGPTYIPLTDFGPTSGINVGGIAVFPRNNDPRQSILFVATGEGDTGTGGAGFMRSEDGGATWTVLDSTDNTLPFAARDHAFKGSTSFKVIVDPHLTPSGDVVVYAALSGQNGGIWRSLDSGETWGIAGAADPVTGKVARTANLAGNATDVAFDLNSGPIDEFSNPTGNLQTVYGAIRGQGVFRSSNQGAFFSLMTGGVGDPLIQDTDKMPVKAVTVSNDAVSPNGGFGRIELAKPSMLFDQTADPNAPVENQVYSGWLYAAVVGLDDHLQGLYLTKDEGQNWTKLTLPTVGPARGDATGTPQAVPSNDTRLPNYDPLGNPTFAQGNYDVSLVIDPLNPNVVYLGGTADGQPSGLIRVDSTTINDPHAFFLSNTLSDGGQLNVNTTGPVTLKPAAAAKAPTGNDPRTNPTINLIPNAAGGQDISVNNVASFGNSGAGVKWIPFDVGGTDQHRAIAFRDPVTGRTRLIFGDDQGVFTTVDNGDGTMSSGIGTAQSVAGARNGNLQITQFYYGAAQPSQSAADQSGALLFGQAQDNGFPASVPNVLNSGDISWGFNGPGAGDGDGTGIATDQQGSGTLFQYKWPCCGGGFPDNNGSDFFQVNGQGRTNGLIQSTAGKNGTDPQWPFEGGFNFALNPVNDQQLVISSGAGRVFRTENQGILWSVIGDPAIFGGANSPALAFGAPQTQGTGSLDNFIYAGTAAGKVFVTFTGGGANGTNWININNGALATNTAPFAAFATDPARGSHDAFAVTSNGVYYISNSDPTSGAVWQNISGNLFAIKQSPFGDPSLANNKYGSLTSIQADWRYSIPDTPATKANPNPPTHPLLYVGGDGGVVRSLDKGVTWTPFPSQEAGSLPSTPTPPGAGGGLPTAHVSDLDMSIGNVDPTTGRSIAQPGDPNVLVATTYGSGSFAIRLAPVVFSTTLSVDPNLPTANSATTTGGVITVTTRTPTIDGVSEQTAFGNVARITLLDLTDPNNPVVIGGYDPADPTTFNNPAFRTDSTGHFAIPVNANGFTANGVKTIGVQATDLSGTQGNIAKLAFTLNAKFAAPGAPAAPTLLLLNGSGVNGNFTNSHTPTLFGKTDPGVQVVVTSLNTNTALPAVTSDGSGNFRVQLPFEADGVYGFQAVATNTATSLSSTGPQLSITVKTSGPASAPTLAMLPADDTGIPGDGVTSRRITHVTGQTDPFAVVSIYVSRNGVPVGSALAQGTANAQGVYVIPLPAQNDGTIQLQATAVDAAGNAAPPPTAAQVLTVRFVTEPADFIGRGLTTPSLFRRNPNGTATWILQSITGPAGTPFGASSTDIPLVGDFDGDGVSDKALYRPNAGAFFIARSRAGGETVSLAPYSTAASLPFTGDFEGDGVTDFGLYNPVSGVWTVSESTNGLQQLSMHSNVFTPKAGDVPVPGNYDGTGKAELAVYRPSTGQFFVQTPGQSNGFDNTRVTTPLDPTRNPGDVPVPGNYDDTATQHVDLPAVFNPTTGVYYVQGNAPLQFNPGDIPAPGDYNGLGQLQPAVYRPRVNAFAIVNVGIVPLGAAGDIPVTSPLFYRGVVKTTPTLGLVTNLPGSNVTSSRHPILGGTTDPGLTVNLLDASGRVINGAVADSAGNFQVGVPQSLSDGTYAFTVQVLGPGGTAGPASPPVSVRVVTTQGDYIGSGKTQPDLFLRTGSTLYWYVQNFGPLNGKAFGASTADVPLSGDFLGSGQNQLATYTQRTGTWTIGQQSTGYAPQVILSNFGTSTGNAYVPAPADYNGNGVEVPAVYEKSTGRWFIAGQPTVQPITAFKPGDEPVPGDYANTGKAQEALYRPSNQTFYIQGAGPFGTGTPIGLPGTTPNDVPAPGAYFSTATTHATDVALWQPTLGQYLILNPATGIQKYKFAVGDIPAPGDYDGVGRTEPAVFRPSTGQFLVIGPQDGATPRVVTTQGFGGANFLPVTSPYPYRAIPGTQPFLVKSAAVAAAHRVITPAANLGATAVTFQTPTAPKSLTPAPAASPHSVTVTRTRPLQGSPAKASTPTPTRFTKTPPTSRTV